MQGQFLNQYRSSFEKQGHQQHHTLYSSLGFDLLDSFLWCHLGLNGPLRWETRIRLTASSISAIAISYTAFIRPAVQI